jgi:LacI family transcriptional regulator
VASIKDVARLAGVSVGTASNVLNRPDSVSPERRERVERAIAELGFVRNEPARQLRAGVSRTIAVVVLDIANPFFADLVNGAEEVAERHDALVVVCNSGGDPDREARHLRRLEQQRVMGVLLTPVREVATPELLALMRHHTPVVLVDRVAAAAERPSVAVDDVRGGALVGELLAAAGHRQVAFLGGPRHLRQVADRLAGLHSTLGPAEVRLLETAEMSIRAGSDCVGEVLAGPPETWPTALFCANDLLAIGAVNECIRRGVSVPDQLSVVGYDDIDLAATASVPLTTVRQPSRQLGCTAVDLLLAEVTGTEPPTGRQVVFEPELVVRSSTGPAAPRPSGGAR